MEARKCDRCGNYYEESLDNKIVLRLDIDKHTTSKEPLRVHVAMTPYTRRPNEKDEARDLCPSCKRHVVYLVGQALRKKAARQGP